MGTHAWMKWTSYSAALLVASLQLAGCLAPAQPERMAAHGVPARVEPAVATGRLRDQVAIAEVTGGKETRKVKMVAGDFAEVGNDQLREALRLSLQDAGYLAPDQGSAAALLKVNLVDLEKPPSGGFSISVVVIMRYVLTDRASGKPWFDELVTASCERGVADDLNGSTRVRHAEECAVRNNIMAFVGKLAAADPAH